MYCTRKINDDYTWVGADCRRLAMFEGVYDVPQGISFNSYLLTDEKTVLFDTVDSAVRHTFRENLTHALAGRELDYVVVHHMEPDHAAELADLLRDYPQTQVLCSAITTPHSSATGITRFKKYSMFCHSPSSPSSPYARMRSRTSSCV